MPAKSSTPRRRRPRTGPWVVATIGGESAIASSSHDESRCERGSHAGRAGVRCSGGGGESAAAPRRTPRWRGPASRRCGRWRRRLACGLVHAGEPGEGPEGEVDVLDGIAAFGDDAADGGDDLAAVGRPPRRRRSGRRAPRHEGHWCGRRCGRSRGRRRAAAGRRRSPPRGRLRPQRPPDGAPRGSRHRGAHRRRPRGPAATTA